MNRKPGVLLGWFLLCLTAILPAGGRGEKAPVVRVTGIVRLVGSSPFSEPVITGPEDQWHIAKDERDKLYNLQHRTVTVEGEETVVEQRFANGLPAGIRRELRNIRIIAVE